MEEVDGQRDGGGEHGDGEDEVDGDDGDDDEDDDDVERGCLMRMSSSICVGC